MQTLLPHSSLIIRHEANRAGAPAKFSTTAVTIACAYFLCITVHYAYGMSIIPQVQAACPKYPQST